MLSAYNFRRDIFSLYHHRKSYWFQTLLWKKIQKPFLQIHKETHQSLLNTQTRYF